VTDVYKLAAVVRAGLTTESWHDRGLTALDAILTAYDEQAETIKRQHRAHEDNLAAAAENLTEAQAALTTAEAEVARLMTSAWGDVVKQRDEAETTIARLTIRNAFFNAVIDQLAERLELMESETHDDDWSWSASKWREWAEKGIR